ncbi:MAG: fatty acid desaturase [Planctomycetota bacterium]
MASVLEPQTEKPLGKGQLDDANAGPDIEPDFEPPGAVKLERPPTSTPEINWIYAGGFLTIHALSLFALVPWLFSWSGVVLWFGGLYFFGVFGINLGYHRLLTHRGLKVPMWLERSFAVIGLCNLQDAPARWVGVHRMHHQFSDHQRDPHSPLVDFLWGHVGWLVYRDSYISTMDFYDRYARDLIRDPFYRWLERGYVWGGIYAAHAALFYSAGLAAGWAYTGEMMAGVQLGLSWLVWGVFFRTATVWHITWSVNSLSHLWGYANYETRDHSLNNWFVALITSGEGWHNNHHAKPRCAAHGHRWWEVDLVYWAVLALERVGLAKDVVHLGGKKK